MPLNKKELICKLLKGIETGDPASVSVVNEEKYIQHNPQTHEGSEGLAVLFKRLSKTSPRVNIVRVFEDGNYVFAHTEYDFDTRNIGFEIFRFENDQAVEHWDNIQTRKGPNNSGHSMVDGVIDVKDLALTENNRAVVQTFVERILVGGLIEDIEEYVDSNNFSEHNPELGDDVTELGVYLAGDAGIDYQQCHRILCEGNFCLSVCEGVKNQRATSFFDLYRVESGKIVEHWDTTEAIPPRSEWKNNNGKF